MSKIYLAGKVRGNKTELIKGLPDFFVSSDGYKGHGDHDWSDFDHHFGSLQSQVEEHFINIWMKCDFMIAYLDESTSYGSIAEIAWNSARGKKTYLIIDTNHAKKKRGEYRKIFYDEYWFISNFPGVEVYETNNFEDSKKLVHNIIYEHYLSPIEKMFNEELQKGDFPYKNYEIQYDIDNKYRLDFAFPEFQIAVELDGHDYHKTKDQRTSDSQRDRYLLSKGWVTIRFTGTEIYHNTSGCVDELCHLITDTNERMVIDE